jgi:type VI secretion system protein VasG
MSEISRVSLFGKLNPLVYKTIEGATVFCKLRGNPYVELVHWMTQLLENNASDVHAIVRHYALDAAVLEDAYRGFTKLADRKKNIYDQDLLSLLPAGQGRGSQAAGAETLALDYAQAFGG